MPTDWNEWEVAEQPTAPAPAPAQAAAPVPPPAAAPQSSSFMDFLRGTPSIPESPGFPGLGSRLGTAIRTIPPAVNPLLAGATDIASIAGTAQPWVTQKLLPAVGSAISNYYPPNLLARGIASGAGYLAGRAQPYIDRGIEMLTSGVNRGLDALSGAGETAIGGPEAVQAWGQVFNPSPALPQDMPPAGPIVPPGPPQYAPPAGPIGLPVPPMDPSQRVVGKIYQTPAGPRRWAGQGWVRVNGL